MAGNRFTRAVFFWPAALLIRFGQFLLRFSETRFGRYTVRPAFRLFCRFVLYARPYLLVRPRTNDVLPTPQLREVIHRQKVIAVIPCVCRAGKPPCAHPLHGEHELDVCLSFGPAALVQIGSGLGKRLSPDAAVALCQDAAASGLAHHAIYSLGALVEVCNCCAETCSVVKAYEAGVAEAVRPSPYVAIRGSDCDGCEARTTRICEEICPYGKSPSSPECFGCGLCAVHCPRGAIVMKPRDE